MRFRQNFITGFLVMGLFLPQSSLATASSQKTPFYLSLLEKVNTLTNFDSFTATKTRQVPTLTDNITPETIIDTYSGIKITFAPNVVYFSYLNDSTPPTPLIDADPQTFQLIETGTTILATDKQALFIIYGSRQNRVTHIDLPSLKIIYKGEYGETKYLQDKNQTYLIKGMDLIPTTTD